MIDPQQQRRRTFGETPRERPSPSEPEAPHALECVDWCPICRTADVLRATAPPELRDQWQSVQREALLTARALIDSHLERLDSEADTGPRVQDIPIE
jgi:hypothetical protein